MASTGIISYTPAIAQNDRQETRGKGIYRILLAVFWLIPAATLLLIAFFPSAALVLIPVFSLAVSFLGVHSIRRLQKVDNAVRSNEAYFRELSDCTPGMIWVTNESGYRTYVNRTCLEFTGRKLKEEIGFGWLNSVHLDDAQDAYDSFLSSSRCKIPTRLLYRLKRHDGTYRCVLDLGCPRYDARGRFVGYIGFVVDIEQQKETERLLEAALSARDEFISIASHELRTPLTSLKLFLQMTQRTHNRNDRMVSSRDIASVCEASLKQVNSLEHLVENLIDVSRIRAGNLSLHPETIHMAELVRKVAGRFAELSAQAGNYIELNVDESLQGRWDPYRLEQMLGNLLSNSIKYAPGKPIVISAHKEDDHVVLKVRDQGPGIPTDKLAEVFERYARPLSSKVNLGMGLGLYITRGLVGAHGGTIEAENTRGNGTSIKIELPLMTDSSYCGVRVEEVRTSGIGA